LRRELLIAAGAGEWRAALLEDGVPADLFVERGDRSEAGSIHLGRVRRLLPALHALLVDTGGERPAFLPQSEVVPRGRRLNEGERVLLQIRREAQGGKAARATMAIALRGRVVELTVGRPGLKGGEELTPDKRCQLIAALDTLTHSARAGSPLSRTAVGGAVGLKLLRLEPFDTLTVEMRSLALRWHNILGRAAALDPPARLEPVASLAAALASALPVLPDEVLVDDAAPVRDIRAAFPDIPVEHLPETEWSVDLEAVFDHALSETIALPAGGSVHFETTRAGVLIDVDTGTSETGSPERVALATNLTAASSIARQLRLRNLGGGIVIDFVGLDSRTLREKVRAALGEALAPDPAQPRILGWTHLGHLELVRPRRGRALSEALLDPHLSGALVKTAVTIAHEALRALRREARAQPGRRWRLIVTGDVAAALADDAANAVRDAEQRFARGIAIETDSSYERERFQISPL
jgi:Rne/Rng family ribonuclease